MIVFLLYYKNQHSTDRCQFLGGSTSLSSLSSSSTRAYYLFLHLILQNISSRKLFFFFATTYSPAFLPSFLLFLMLRLYRHRPSSTKTSFSDTYLPPKTIAKTQHRLPTPNDAIILIFYRQITSYHNTAPCHTNTILYHTTTTPLTPIVTKTTTSTVPTYLKLLLLSGTYLTLPYLFQKYLILLFPTYHTITSHSTRRHLPY